eukprot:544117_1
MADKSFQTVHLASEGVEIIPGYSAVKISIKDMNNKTMTLEVEPNCTIWKIKHLINDKKNIPIEEQTIIFKGKELQNELDLSYYDIKNNHILHLVNSSSITSPKSNPTDDSILEEKLENSNNNKSALETDKDVLAKILSDHGLYDVLYSKLIENQIDLETLQNDLPENEINGFSDDFELNTTQKVKFRKLMRSIYKQQNPDSKMVAILVGDSGVGKTCLMNQYVKNTYNDCTSTIGVGVQNTVETLADNSTMKMTIWDTAGQERFHSVCRTYYRRADCIIMCYDASIEMPFINIENWKKEIENYGNNKCVIVLVGCKIDKIKSKQIYQLNVSKAESIVEQMEWMKFSTIHYECSAKTGDNVRNVFLAAAELVLMNRPNKNEINDIVDELQKEIVDKNTTKCCF